VTNVSITAVVVFALLVSLFLLLLLEVTTRANQNRL